MVQQFNTIGGECQLGNNGDQLSAAWKNSLSFPHIAIFALN